MITDAHISSNPSVVIPPNHKPEHRVRIPEEIAQPDLGHDPSRPVANNFASGGGKRLKPGPGPGPGSGSEWPNHRTGQIWELKPIGRVGQQKEFPGPWAANQDIRWTLFGPLGSWEPAKAGGSDTIGDYRAGAAGGTNQSV